MEKTNLSLQGGIMIPHSIQAIVLAGKNTDGQYPKIKFLEKICGKEMIIYPLQLLESLHIPTTLVIGFPYPQIKKTLEFYNFCKLNIIEQTESLGNGHATMLTESLWTNEHILLINADIPLITDEVISRLINKHIKTDADISFITAHGIDIEHKNYCRVVINDNKIQVLKNSDMAQDPHNQCCISGGVYVAKKSFLQKHIHQLTQSSINHEYYLPELVQIASNHHGKVVTFHVSIDAIRHVDTLADIWAIEHIKRSQIIQHWMNQGVRIANALTVMIDESVQLEPGVFIDSGVHLLGNSIIKQNTHLGAHAYIENSTIEAHAIINPHVYIKNAHIPAHATIEPFTLINKKAQAQLKNKSGAQEKTKTFTGAIKVKHPIKTSQL